MKKKFFSLILAFAFIVPCMIALTACGGGNNPPHTHSWSSDWVKTETEHYKTCSGCDEKSERANHDIVGDTCSVCEYVVHTHDYGSNYQKDDTHHWQVCTVDGCSQTTTKEAHSFSGDTCSTCGYINAQVVSKIQDLKMYTYQPEGAGFTYVELPDGKNMLIDTGTNSSQGGTVLSSAIQDEVGNLKEIDYLILTSTTGSRCGGVSYLDGSFEDLFVVKNFYYIDTTGTTQTISTELTNAKNILAQKIGCESFAISDNSDFTINFKEQGKSQVYSYTIDFTVAVTPASATNIFDNQVYVSITYNDKTILLTGDATNANIDGYISKTGNVDVDVLVTGFHGTYFDAISNSGSSGRTQPAFLTKINLSEGDYAIITVRSNLYINDLHTALYNAGAISYSFASLEQPRVITTITKDGSLNVAPSL